MFVLLFILAASGNAGMSEPSGYDWDIASAESVIQRDMIADADGDVDALTATNATDRTAPSYYVQFTYEKKSCSKSNDIFSPATLQAMCEIEARVYHGKFSVDISKGKKKDGLLQFKETKGLGWNDFCQMADGSCEQPTSVTNLFYGSNHNYTCERLDASTVSSTAADLYDALDTTAGELAYGYFVSKKTINTDHTCWTRSLFKLGSPLENFGYKKESVIGDPQFYDISNYLLQVCDNLFTFFDMEATAFPTRSAYFEPATTAGLDVTWFSYPLNNAEMMNMVATDQMMAICSILFVWVWIVIHTGSFFVGSLGMLQVVMSLPVSMFFYKLIFQIHYFETLQGLAIFVILGVGADDIFVMVDAWKQSGEEIPIRDEAYVHAEGQTKVDPSRFSYLHRRMIYAYGRALQAVFNTSFTTAVAFLATAVSPIMPISTFGIFAALCILMNYLFVMTLTPATIIIQELYMSPTCSCYCCGKGQFGPLFEVEADAVGENKAKPPEENETKPGRCNDLPERFIQGFMGCMEYKVGEFKVVAWAMVIFLTGYGIFSAASASQLTPPREAEQWFPDNHLLYRNNLADKQFLTGDDDSYAKFEVVYGMKGLNRADYNIYIPANNRGDTTYDSNFDLSEASAQDAFLDACESMRTWPCKASGCQFGLLIRPNTTSCFLEEFQSWHKDKYSGVTTYDITSTEFFNRLSNFRQTEAPKGDPYGTWETTIGFINGKLKYAKIESRMTLKLQQSVTVKRPIIEIAEDFQKSLTSTSTLPEPFQYTWDWVWYTTEEGLLFGLMLGMSIAMPVAFITLTFATSNVILAFYAIVSIGFVVSSVLGGIRAYFNWDLGIAESVAGVIVIGLAVDYTIHLGHMYDHAKHEIGATTREERFRFATGKMGTTVFAGAITTAGSGTFLFFTQLLFFSKMAMLIVLTIVFSFIYSFGFFLALCYVAGPENETGSLHTLLPRQMYFLVKSNSDGQKPEANKIAEPTKLEDTNAGSSEF